MPQRTVPVQKSTREFTKVLKNLYVSGSYDDFLLELLAQYDPDDHVLDSDDDRADRLREILARHEIPDPMLETADVEIDLDQPVEEDADVDGRLVDADEPVTT